MGKAMLANLHCTGMKPLSLFCRFGVLVVFAGPLLSLPLAAQTRPVTNLAAAASAATLGTRADGEQLSATVIEDDSARITEVRRRGRTTHIDVQSKHGPGTYQVAPQTPSTSSNGASTWRLLSW